MSKNGVACFACEKLLKLPYEDWITTYQFDNNLWIQFLGGYGMFIDTIEIIEDLHPDNYKVTICHECAHDLCDKIPWINKLLNPYNSHSHTQKYHDENPGHFGWDYDRQNKPA